MKSQQATVKVKKCSSLHCFWFNIQKSILINYIALYSILFLNILGLFFNLENRDLTETVKVKPKISILDLTFHFKIACSSFNKHFLCDALSNKILGTK